MIPNFHWDQGLNDRSDCDGHIRSFSTEVTQDIAVSLIECAYSSDEHTFYSETIDSNSAQATESRTQGAPQ